VGQFEPSSAKTPPRGSQHLKLDVDPLYVESKSRVWAVLWGYRQDERIRYRGKANVKSMRCAKGPLSRLISNAPSPARVLCEHVAHLSPLTDAGIEQFANGPEPTERPEPQKRCEYAVQAKYGNGTKSQPRPGGQTAVRN
jgi:hypothetical protein